MQKEALECTFKPKINEGKINTSFFGDVDIHKRNLLWQQNKNHKITHLKREKDHEELTECTFAPQIRPLEP